MSGAPDQTRRFCVLSWDQVQRLDSILGEAVPIHGRGNFPTLAVQPRQIVQKSTICCIDYFRPRLSADDWLRVYLIGQDDVLL